MKQLTLRNRLGEWKRFFLQLHQPAIYMQPAASDMRNRRAIARRNHPVKSLSKTAAGTTKSTRQSRQLPGANITTLLKDVI